MGYRLASIIPAAGPAVIPEPANREICPTVISDRIAWIFPSAPFGSITLTPNPDGERIHAPDQAAAAFLSRRLVTAM